MNLIGGIGLMIYGVMLVAIAAVYAVKKMRRCGLGMVLIAACFLHSMATKPGHPTVTFDDYLADNGTAYTTNSAGTVTGVDLKWKRTDTRLPLGQTVYISTRQSEQSAWTTIGTATVATGEYHYTTGATNYEYYVWHEFVPGSPVHTNGVWLGSIISPTTNAAKTNEWIVGKGKIYLDSVEIAPKRNDE